MKKFLLYGCFAFFAFAAWSIRQTYVTQDRSILLNSPLSADYVYSWSTPFEEIFIDTPSGSALNGLWFKSNNPGKQVMLFFHGRGHNLAEFHGAKMQEYLRYGYDVFGIDYRGFGKSMGETSEATLLEDSELAYQFLQQHYAEKDIVVYGQSLGTGFATYVAANHHPRLLILEAPYYNMVEMANMRKPFIPKIILDNLLKYHLRTDLWIKNVKTPIHIFHGTKDAIIPYASSEKLVALLKDRDDVFLYTLPDWGHVGIPYRKDYQDILQNILLSSEHVD